MKPVAKAVVGISGGVIALLALLAAWAFRTETAPLPELTGSLRHGTIVTGGRERSFLYYVPAVLRRPTPLILALHGSMGSGTRMRAATGYEFDRLADGEGFVVAYPDGYEGRWNDCRAVGDFAARRLGVDDVGFLRALAGWLEREQGVAPDRVFATGISNGGHMVYRLATEAPGLTRGIAAVAANLPAEGNQICGTPSLPVAALVISGTDDPLAPYGGGEGGFFGKYPHRGPVVSAPASARYWARLAGYSGAPRRESLPDRDPDDGTRAARFVWSEPGRPGIVFIRVEGGGHAFPHPRASMPRLLGRTSHDFSAAEEIWRFFERQMPPP